MDIGNDLFLKIFRFFAEYLNMDVVFFGYTIPMWSFFAFAFLAFIFWKLISIIAGIHV